MDGYDMVMGARFLLACAHAACKGHKDSAEVMRRVHSHYFPKEYDRVKRLKRLNKDSLASFASEYGEGGSDEFYVAAARTLTMARVLGVKVDEDTWPVLQVMGYIEEHDERRAREFAEEFSAKRGFAQAHGGMDEVEEKEGEVVTAIFNALCPHPERAPEFYKIDRTGYRVAAGVFKTFGIEPDEMFLGSPLITDHKSLMAASAMHIYQAYGDDWEKEMDGRRRLDVEYALAWYAADEAVRMQRAMRLVSEPVEGDRLYAKVFEGMDPLRSAASGTESRHREEVDSLRRELDEARAELSRARAAEENAKGAMHAAEIAAMRSDGLQEQYAELRDEASALRQDLREAREALERANSEVEELKMFKEAVLNGGNDDGEEVTDEMRRRPRG